MKKDKMVELLIESRVESFVSIQGCSTIEVDEIEKKFMLKLPLEYREFLSVFGKETANFLSGSDFTYPRVLELRESAQRLLDETDSPYSLKETDFVFFMHQGYAFLFFTVDGSPDPPVMRYHEFEEVCQVTKSFSEWLDLVIYEHTQ
jgi:SMI1-KNR4 cell-wall